MDPAKSECYEFLDLSDVDDSERSQLKESLFGNPPEQYLLHFPWAPDHHSNSIETNSNASTQYSEPVYNQQWTQPPPHQYGVVPLQQNHGPMLNNTQQTPFYHPVIVPMQFEAGYYYIPEASMTESPIPGDNSEHSGRDSPSISVVSTGGSSGIMSPHSTVGGNGIPPTYPPQQPQMFVQPPPGPVPAGAPMSHTIYVNNVTANLNVVGPYMGTYYVPQQGYPQVQPEQNPRMRSRTRHHRPAEDVSQQPAYVPYMPQYPSYPPAQMAAQQVTGSPLFISPTPVYYGGFPAHSTLVYPTGIPTEYQYPAEPVPEVDPHYQQPPPPPPQNLVTTVTVSHDQPQSKKPSKPYTQVQIKQNIETFEPSKPQVVVMTPAPEVINGSVTNVEKKVTKKVKVPKPAKFETEQEPVKEVEAVPEVKIETKVEELSVETLTISTKVPKKKSNVTVKSTMEVNNNVNVSEKVPTPPIQPKEIISEVPKEPEPAIESGTPEPQEQPVAASSSQKSWASLFKARTEAASAASVQQVTPTPPVNTSTPPSVSQTSASTNTPPSVTTKPLARVLPFDKTVQEKKFSKPEKTSSFFDDPNAYRMGEFLLKYTIDNKTISLLPRGLTNRSIFCYVNSILQALLACPPFCNLMHALSQQKNFNQVHQRSSTPIIDCMMDFMREFTPLPAGARIGRKERTSAAAAAATNGNKNETLDAINCGTAVDPACVYRAVNKIRGDSFSADGRQEDAEEFLGCLLNALNDEMVELMKLVDENVAITNKTNKLDNNNVEDEDEWTIMGPKNKGSITRKTDFGRSPISDIFRGQLRSRIQRAGHQQSTDNVQPFFTLQLDIEKTNSVKEALELLAGKNSLEGVTCSKTQQAIEAWQQVSLEELPLVLILHLKCFNYEGRGCTKIIKNVEFPVDLKIDAKLISANRKYTNKQKQYKLFAAVYHDGKEAYIGHYITDAFHVGYGGWVRYDDAIVRGIPESQVLRPRAPRMPYLLYYRRCDTIGNQQPTTQPAPPRSKKE